MKLKSNIDLKLTLLSGQCFRVIKESDGSFTTILKDRVINIKKENDYLEIKSNKEENLKNVVIKYFDLERNYDEIINEVFLKNSNLKEVLNYSKNYKILNQDKFEMIISYIISQNNRVSKISYSINKISELYGEKVTFQNKEYYLFPTYDKLKNITKEELKECKVGFRDKYILDALFKLNEENYIDNLSKMNTEDALEKLMYIKGIGLKVASCILLFSFERFDTFPIDTWVKKYFNEDNINIIRDLSDKKYGKYKGIVLQYIFNYSRNKEVL